MQQRCAISAELSRTADSLNPDVGGGEVVTQQKLTDTFSSNLLCDLLLEDCLNLWAPVVISELGPLY